MKIHCCLLPLFLLPLHAEELALRSRDLLDQHPEARVIEGSEGWKFLATELRYLAKGTDWIHPATPPDPAHADPLPALRRLKNQLSEMNIELIMVPVPAKASVYPEHLPGGSPPAVGAPAPFVEQLQREDFNVVDLRTLFRTAKADAQLYCKTDTHWSPRGAELAAETVANLIKELTDFDDYPVAVLQADPPADITIQGDLTDDGDPTETLSARRVTRTDGESVVQDTAPVLLLGDSHTLVFSEGGDMHARDSGFLEHLALNLQRPIDRLANRGSGSTPSRMSLYRKAARDPEWLENKRAVIYLFTSRELTESINGWRVLPLAPRFR